jgi:RNA polymerase sigma factor (sigma-70 family)
VATHRPGLSDDHTPAKRGGSAESNAIASLSQSESGDVDLVIRMRTGAAVAFEQFVERFHPVLLDYARRAGVDQPERDELVSDVLSDVALHFLTPGIGTPRNPRMYLITAFRNRLLNGRRGHMRREHHHATAVREAALDSDYADDGDAAAGCSEDAVRESRGPGWERAVLPRALALLAVHLDEALTSEERQLLVAVAENVPQREVAEWLGVSHVVARKRLERLRGRMMQVAMRYTNALAPDDAREVQRFFRRCRARIGASEGPGNGPSETPDSSNAPGGDEPNQIDAKGNAQ